jgi:hypothetical protein
VGVKTPVRKSNKAVARKSNINPALEFMVVPLDTLKPDPKNVRIHNDRQIEVMRNSLQTYGQVTPIVQVKGVVVKGNATLEAAKQLGWTHIAAVPLKLERKLVDEYKLVDNRSSDLSYFDDGLLLPELNTLLEEGSDLNLLGWNEEDLKLLEEAIEDGEVEQLPSDATLLDQLSVTVEEPKTKLERGMVREVGNHILIVCDPVKDADIWFPYMKKEFLFAPYPGPYIALSLTSESRKILMVQPDVFIAGYIVDRYEEIESKKDSR